MRPILHKGYVRITGFPDQKRQHRAWQFDLTDYEEFLLTLGYCEKKGSYHDALGEFFMKLADHCGRRNGWNLYSFYDDMKAYAVMCMFLMVPRFNPQKVTKPYVYFIQVTINAFKQYTNKERKYQETQQNYAELIQESASIYGYPLREEE